MIEKASTNYRSGTEDFDVCCDSCGYATDYTVSSWDELMDSMRADGWRSVKEGADWEHKCSDCCEADRCRKVAGRQG